MPMSAGYIRSIPILEAALQAAGGGSTRIATCLGRRRNFPTRRSGSTRRCDAPKEKLFALRDFLGFDKNVIVQASCHSKDNRAMVDALETSNNKAEGVAFVGEEVTDAELKAMDRAGVKGVRFNFVRRLVDFTPRDVLERIAARVAPLGWHIVVYFEMPDLPDLEPSLLRCRRRSWSITWHPRCEEGRGSPGEPALPSPHVRHENFWVKVTCPERMTVAAHPMTTWRPLPAASWNVSLTGSCGAPIGRTPT